jgi:hypothetical protein
VKGRKGGREEKREGGKKEGRKEGREILHNPYTNAWNGYRYSFTHASCKYC